METKFLNILPSYFRGISVLLSILGCLLVFDSIANKNLIPHSDEAGILCFAISFLVFLFSKERLNGLKERALVLSVAMGAVLLIAGLIICICLDSIWNIVVVLYVSFILQYVLFFCVYYCLWFFQRKNNN